jgi:hypothetical protein
MRRICVTRALKNARYLQKVAPHIIPPEEPMEGFGSLVPLEVLTVLHRKQGTDIRGHNNLTQLLKMEQLPVAGNQALDPLFNGTLHFVQITFTTTTGSVAVSTADMTTAVQYATLAAVPIAAYASQYGSNAVNVSQTILQFNASVPSAKYNDQTLQGWVNTITNQNGLPGSACLIILNPHGVTNTDGDINQGILGYHGKANVPYCFVNVFGTNLTVADEQDFYAWQLSHEIAEMTVDPNVDGHNPEVCDACGPNCPPSWRDFFVPPNNTYSQTTDVFPPGFTYSFFINAIVQPNSAQQCPAPQTACAYAPPRSPAASGPVVSWGANRLDVFVVGTDSALYHKWWSGSAWGPSLTGYEAMSGVIIGDPEAVSWGPNRLDVFVIGTNSELYHKWWNGSAWGPSLTGYEAMGGTVVGNPKVVSWGSSRLDVFVIGTNSELYHKWWDGSAWGPSFTGYEAMGGTIVGDPEAVSWGPNRLDVFVLGTDLAVYHKWWDGSAWGPSLTGWERMGGVCMSPPHAVCWGPNRIDLFVVGTDRALYHKWWDGSAWGPSLTGWERQGGVISDF